MPVVVISPFNVARFPQGGGHFWVYLQYALALRLLGCDVYWLEAFRRTGREEEEAAALGIFHRRMQQYGFAGKFILYAAHQEPASRATTEYLNMPTAEAETIIEGADLLLNFHYAINRQMLSHFRRTALIDIDPGLLQLWIRRGQLDVPRHDFYFTTGERVSLEEGTNCRVQWTHIRPPVFLESWPYVFDAHSESFTTISIWDSSDWVVDGDDVYENTKRVAFMEFADLPGLTDASLELALFLRTERDMSDQRELERRGWRIRRSHDVAATPEMYQGYIQRSRGEFSCAKRSYTRFQNAWISDRTLCYLASGKPVVVQNTGPSCFLPSGQGLFRFSTMADAVRALSAINADYESHCQAARGIAEAYFDARQIIGRLLDVTLTPS